ncbi:MAG: hypothetical protein AAGE83_12945 [Pseudomonadota bacterium]
MIEPYDSLETRSPAAREAAQFEALRAQLRSTSAPALRDRLTGVALDALTGRDMLAVLPVLRKSDLVEMQRANPPFGGLAGLAPEGFDEIFQSPGPIYEPGRSSAKDWWRFARALHAGGIGAGTR